MLLFVLGAGVGLWWFSAIILPISYGVPKSLYWIARGKLKWKALFVYLGGPAIWTAVFVGAAALLGTLWPKAVQYLHNSAGFFFGQWFGVICALIRAATKSGRRDLEADFLSVTARHPR
jgi:hypothetical protein